jgi:hypothetical protein
LCNGAEAVVNSGSVAEEKWDLCNGAEAGVRSCALCGCPHKINKDYKFWSKQTIIRPILQKLSK